MTINTWDIADAISKRIEELKEERDNYLYGSLGKQMYKDKNARTAAANDIDLKIFKLKELEGLFR